MRNVSGLQLLSGGLAAALCIGPSASGAGAQTPPPPIITEAFADAESATLTINGVGFRAGFPMVFLGNHELPVRWATESTAAAWLPELRPGTYRLIARWPDGSQADFYLTLGAVGPAGPEGSRGPEGPRGLPGPGGAHFGDPPAAAEAEDAAAETSLPSSPVGTTRYGTDALRDLTTGIRNTAFGFQALIATTSGGSNTAVGWRALTRAGSGRANVAVGSTAQQTSGGSFNIAVGRAALRYIRGSRNIAIGDAAGAMNPTGNNNVYLGHWGVAGESGIIRIGTPGTHKEIHLTGRVVAPGFVPTYQPPPVSAAGAWTDDPIRSGETPVRAVHFTELRAHVDRRRAAAGLDPFPWTDPVLTAGVTPVRRAHLLELRTALAAAYAAVGRPAPRWTDAPPGSPIQAAHLTELRTAVLEY